MRDISLIFLLSALILASSCSLSSEEAPAEEEYQQETNDGKIVEENNISVAKAPTPKKAAPIDSEEPLTEEEQAKVNHYNQLVGDLKNNLNTDNPNELQSTLQEIQAIRLEAEGTVIEKAIEPANTSVAMVLGSRIATSEQKGYDKGLYRYFIEGSDAQADPNALSVAPQLPPRVYYPETVKSEEISLTLESIQKQNGYFTLNFKVKNNKPTDQLVTLFNVQLVNRSKKVLKPEDQGNRWKVPGEYDIYKFEGFVPGWDSTPSGQIYRQFSTNEEQLVAMKINGDPDFFENSYSLMLSCNTANFMFNTVFPSD